MKKFTTILFVILVNLVSVIIVIGYIKLNNPKTAYVDLAKVFDKFAYKKELTKKMELTKNARQHIIDSLKTDIQNLAKQIEFDNKKNEKSLEKLNYLRQEFYSKKQQIDEDNNAMIRKYDSEIWSQLNQYFFEFGEKHKYSFIFGNNGSGNVIYSEKCYDITDEIISYVNQSYDGKLK